MGRYFTTKWHVEFKVKLAMKIDLKEYGPIISSKTIGTEVYAKIKDQISENEQIEIDLSEIKTMATFCAKQIFGKLYLELGPELFFEKIVLKGASNDVKTIIQVGIQHALEEND